MATSIFIFIDRFLSGRPIASFRIEGGYPAIRIKNVAPVDILIREIRAEPKSLVGVSNSTSVYDILSALVKGETVAMLEPGEERSFPLLGKGETKLEDAPSQRIRLRIIWRRCNRTWLPQFPKKISTSTDDLRSMAAAAD